MKTAPQSPRLVVKQAPRAAAANATPGLTPDADGICRLDGTVLSIGPLPDAYGGDTYARLALVVDGDGNLVVMSIDAIWAARLRVGQAITAYGVIEPLEAPAPGDTSQDDAVVLLWTLSAMDIQMS